ncbi:GBS Bsp-like repeat-containing protein [Clostridium estertheticum]|uniref:GBS Bsp-like repeat-containing protein n=1 Tax=Clostridium estertheticum TaxID=238834 RepID=UPI001C0B5161|nr:GBS Bsp-like repeat-containing protein [Clostridium estertheticum]MBU3173303.1 GBS Bsp-like repeat-containing protein [Clostridium estertheticum]
MGIKIKNKLRIIIISLIVVSNTILGCHVQYSKNASLSEKIIFKTNVAQAAEWAYVATYGVGMSYAKNSYSVYMDSNYDYELRFNKTNGAVGNDCRITVWDVATPYYIFSSSRSESLESSLGVFQPATSAYYTINTEEVQASLYRKPRANIYRQYGDVLTPQLGYPTSVTVTNKVQTGTSGSSKHEHAIYGDLTTGVTDINLGTMKYDQLSRTFTGVLNSFKGLLDGKYISYNYPYTFYIVDSQGNRTKIFHQDYFGVNTMIGGSRAMTIANVNVPIRMEVILESPTPVTILIPFIDSTPPTVPLLSTTSVGWTNKPIIITAYSSDQSGVQGYEYSWDNSTWSGITGNTYTNIIEGANTLYCRAVDSSGNISASSSIWTGYDVTAPKITSSSVQNIDGSGYDVYVYGVEDPSNTSNATVGSGVNRVQFPTWTENKGQDDIQPNWQTNIVAKGTNLGGGTWHYKVNIADHNNEFSLYDTQIYVWDNAGNFSLVNADTYPVTISLKPQLIIITPPDNTTYSN